MDARFAGAQKKRDILAAFWHRRVSPYVTALLLKTPITPNQTTVLWGLLSVSTSGLVYYVLLGHYMLLPLVALVYIFAEVLDCVDGEIARVRQMSNPIAGKILDGICHRATEYSLLAAAVCAVFELTGSWWSVPVGLVLLSGEAMYTYAYERRLTALRVDARFTGLVALTESSMYERGERWRDLSPKRKLMTIKGLVHYKSIYAFAALSYVSGLALLVGLTLLAVYKHVVWIRLVARTITETGKAAADMPADSTAAVNVVATDMSRPHLVPSVEVNRSHS
jgi:phosphatidylglycerophosphate synthase